ncbi:MAG: hypothetical protein IJ984_01455 [Prevotella sp.]|nr:hypothetical protein [Prevotella sp.]MBR6592069.1 hypothetical protein [Prevotella sp.]
MMHLGVLTIRKHHLHQPPHLCHNDPDSRDRHLYDEQTSWAYQLYADVVMEKKADAVNLTNGLFE